ncbi:MAG: pseudouridine synthase, partial [Chloroflexi bacterium]|nr:pseudouridine synthase [Chloroflexota bacterium]
MPDQSGVGALSGYINVCKPPDVTSHDVVARLRRLVGIRRIGHAGTLDPPAVGVLPVAIGQATRTLQSRAWDRKVYWADVCFGSATDTDDA